MVSEHWKSLRLSAVALRYGLQEYREGVSETYGPNDSPAIREYLREANMDRPAAWCAAFCNWCAKQAAELKGVSSPLEEVKHEAYVESYFRWAKRTGRMVEGEGVGLGDLFLIYFPDKEDPVYGGVGRHAHMGFVRHPPFDTQSFVTLEGNSNEDGSREGIKIASNTRQVTENYKFIRWHDE